MNVSEIIMGLESCDEAFPRYALQRAIAERDLIIPELLGILERAIQNPEDLVDKPQYMGHIYAMFLLAQFREKRAYPVIVQFSLLPEEVLFDLADEVVTGDLNRILASVSCGDDRLMKAVLENEDANEYVRDAAMRGLVTLVACGEKTRDELVEYFLSLFRGKLARDFSFVWNGLVRCSLDIYPGELYEEIERCYRDELAEEFFVSREDVRKELSLGKGKVLERLKENRTYALVTDVISTLGRWACFQPPKPIRPVLPLLPRPPKQEPIRSKKIGRNQPCPCGSGKKYKKCCGSN